ncbi:hypothetical protein BBJ28_00013958 [Nothophytophthora sp. Chile5]|nr:hypothetical protein BBJ28_00013958 [Nothophytophthora sp. Chile5]
MIFTSPYGNIPIPQGKTVWNMLEKHALETPAKTSLVCGLTERSLTFGEVHKQAKQVCAGLAAEGIKKGDASISSH